MSLAVSVANRVLRLVRSCAPWLLASMLATASAQPQPGRLPKVGILELGYGGQFHVPLAEELKALGYVEGRNILYERRYADNHPERLPALAQELVQAKVDVLVAFTNVPAFAARQVTKTVPIVVQGAHGGVETGLFASLARPGGNLTGTETLAPELDAKRVEILKQIVPGLTQLTAVFSPDDPGSPFHLKSTRDGGRQLGIAVTPLEVRRPQDADAARAALATKPPGGLLVFTDVVTDSMLGTLLAQALKDHVPTMCEFGFQVELGCMVAYGPLTSFAERSAHLVDRILKGAKPADLPVEQVTRYELVVNQWAARALGITIPPAVLVRADRVVESKTMRIGVLSVAPAPPVSSAIFVRRLAELGWVTGKNLAWELHYTAGDVDALPEHAASLVRSQVDLIAAGNNSAAFEARRATQTIPIVASAQGMLQTGLVGNLARPGGNLTGMDVLVPELDAKRVELLREMLPRLRRVAVLYNPADTAAPLRLKTIGAAAATLGIAVTYHEVRRPDDYDAAFAAIVKAQPDLVWTPFDRLMNFYWKRVADFALAQRLPTFCEFKPLAQSGCLVSHGVGLNEINDVLARQVDRILRGANPGDLPIERPTHFELVANLKVARSLGVTIPSAVLKRADEVIE